MLKLRDLQGYPPQKIDPERYVNFIMSPKKLLPLTPPRYAKDVNCPICNGNDGFYISNEPHGAVWSCRNDECIQKNACKISSKYFPKKITSKECGVPEEYSNASLCNSTLENKEVLNKFKIFSNKPEGYLVIGGNNGSGKTYHAISILNHYISKTYKSAIFINMPSFYSDYLSHISSGDNFLHKFTVLSNVDMLVIDDLGSRDYPESFLDHLFALINKRKETNNPTIITTNLSSKAISQKFGSAFYSRIFSGIVVKVEREDQRFGKHENLF